MRLLQRSLFLAVIFVSFAFGFVEAKSNPNTVVPDDKASDTITELPPEVVTVELNSSDVDTHVSTLQNMLLSDSDNKSGSSPDARRFREKDFDLTEYDSECYTPTYENGQCVDLRECPGIYIVRDGPFLRRFLCGFAGRRPLICCPSRWQWQHYYHIFQRPNRGSHRDLNRDLDRELHRDIHRDTHRVDPIRPRIPITLPDKCGRSKVSSRVVGGEKSKPGAWPWMAAVYYQTKKASYFACGGALVSQRHVLTAARCVMPGEKTLDPKDLLVRLGYYAIVNNEEDGLIGREMNISKVTEHADFDAKTFKNNIAILHTEEDVSFSAHIAPLCLPYHAVYGTLTGEMAFVTGWGSTSYDGNRSDVLMEASIPVWSSRACRDAYKKEDVTLTSEYICAGDGQGMRDTCTGDSGGPLVYSEDGKYYLIGVVSFGMKCATPGYPGVYTRVTKYLQWLNDHF